MKKSFILISLISLIISCRNGESNQNINSKWNIVELDNEEQIFNEEYTAIRFIIADSLLIVQTKNKDTLFKVYNANSLKKLGSFGKKGDGPNEFSYPYTSNQIVSNESGIQIWINDLWKYKLSLVNITKSIDSGKTILEKEVKFNPKYDFTHDLISLNDSVFYGNHGPDEIERSRISKYNLKRDLEEKVELLPKIKNTDLLNRSSMYSLYYDYLAIKPDQSKLVSAMTRFNRLDIYDLDLNLIKEIVHEDDNKITDVKDILHKDGNQLVNLRNFYYSLYPTSNYIYALHRKGQLAAENGKVNINVDIRVFDWDGNPKYLLKTPNDLTNFSVDEKNGWIYGVDTYNEGLYRYKFDLD